MNLVNTKFPLCFKFRASDFEFAAFSVSQRLCGFQISLTCRFQKTGKFFCRQGPAEVIPLHLITVDDLEE